MKQFNSEPNNINELFSEQAYRIPLLQRRYVWTEEKVLELLEDIQEALEASGRDSGQYFIGGMVFSKDSEGKERVLVIDGQQRMATIMLTFAAAIGRFEQLELKELSEVYKGKVGKSFVDAKTGKPAKSNYLELHDRDNGLFKKLLKGESVNSKTLSVSETNLLTAHVAAKGFVDKMDGEQLMRYMAFMMHNVFIVKTTTENQSTAFKIFETLNAKGSRLEPEDLLKNLLLQKVDDSDYEAFSKDWDKIIENLTEKGSYVVTPSTFLRHYIMSNGKYLSKEGVYDWFKDKAEKYEKEKVLEMLRDLVTASDKYVKFHKGLGNNAVAALRQLLFKQGNIVLLAASELGDTDDRFVEICKALEGVAFAYVITGSKTNELEQKFCEIAGSLREAGQSSDKIEMITKSLCEVSSNKKEAVLLAIRGFRYKSQSDKRKVLYILRKMANALDGASYEAFSIEHVLPETRNGELPGVSDADYNILMSSIGNLTLVSGSDNSSLLNKAFTDKQKVYLEQSCRLTSSIAKPLSTGTSATRFDKAIAAFSYSPVPSKWDAEEIERRAVSMLSLARHIWF